MIKNKRVTIAEWRRQHDVQNDPDADSLDLAYSTFFLNRTNRSGIIFGGVIGGKNQDGPYKRDARFNKNDLIQRIKNIDLFRHSISLHCQDAASLIEPVIPTQPKRALVYSTEETSSETQRIMRRQNTVICLK